ncbi:MAG: hypothetical protein R2864_10845 [Syntrophotaleaceae bacterium]
MLPATLSAGDWPNIERALHDWQGPKQVLLRSSLADPLLSPLVQDLLEELLGAGFTVVPAPQGAAAETGLVLDLRIADAAEVLALRRAEDGAIIAFERHAGVSKAVVAVPVAAPPVKSAEKKQAAVPAPASAPVVSATTRPAGPLYGPLELQGQPRQLAVLDGGEIMGLELGLLQDDKLVRYRLEEFGLAAQGEFSPDLEGKRALHLDAADLDGDKIPELAVVWVEDVRGIYQGTESKPHAWLLSKDLQPLAGEQSGYLRLYDNQAVVQRRGPYKPFKGPVMSLVSREGVWSVDEKPVEWGGDIFASSPVDERLALSRDDRDRLQLVGRALGKALPGGLLLQDLGKFAGPQVAVPLETPEYRSGFGKDDLVRETYHVLPPRVAQAADGSVYTISRGRSAGLPLLGKPSGQDRVVKVLRRGHQLLLEQPFAGVDAYILDFALLEKPGERPAVILLLNDKEDGSGLAHLLIQAGS